MSSLKELSDLDASEGIEFDTVVIDEAARANPLDLFVPMAMARRRIILVGDHRQHLTLFSESWKMNSFPGKA